MNDTPDPLLSALAALTAALKSSPAPSMIIGGIAVIDLDYVRARLREFAEVIDDRERLKQLEELIQRAARLSR